MNTTTRIAAIAISLFATAGAMAQEATYELPQPTRSVLTRAEVQADLAKARASNTLYRNDYEAQQVAPTNSTRSRAEVRAETLQAIASGELQALNSEHGGSEVRFQAKRAAAAATQVAQAAK